MSITTTIALFIIFSAINLSPERYFIAIIMMSASLALAISAVIKAILNNSISPVYITSLVYLISYYIGPGLVHLHNAHFPWYNFIYEEEVASKASLLVFLFTVIMYIGYDPVSSRIKVINRDISVGRFVLLFVGLVLIILAAASVVGFDYLHTRRGDMGELFESRSPAQIALAGIARMGSFILLLITITLVRKVRSFWTYILAIMAIFLFLSVNNLLSLPRYVIGSYLISIFFSQFKQSVRTKLTFVLALCVAQITIFPILSELTRGKTGVAAVPDINKYISEHGDFDGFQSTMNVVAWTEEDRFKYGRQISSAALFFIPSSYATWKSPGTGAESAAAAGYVFTNISSPLPSEFFVDFGYLGLIFFTLAFVRFVNFVDRKYESSLRSGDMLGLITPAIITGYSFIILRGSLTAVLGPLVLSVAISIGAVWWISRSRVCARHASTVNRPGFPGGSYL